MRVYLENIISAWNNAWKDIPCDTTKQMKNEIKEIRIVEGDKVEV